jgi:chromatin assembly factor 1 subunit B
MARRGSATSDAGSAITSASEIPDHLPVLPPSLAGGNTPMTPSTSVPSTPQLANALPPNAAMNPPSSTTKPGSRRSSFSGSQAAASPALSAAVFPGRGRSPSPMPQLPAIRAPPPAISQKLYGDESVTRFFRRLTFSPDGSLLMTPAGQIEDQLFRGSPMLGARSVSQDGSGSEPPTAGGKPKNIDAGRPTVFIYSRANLARAPIAHLPGHKTASVAIRFSPIFYDLRSHPSTAEPKTVMLDREEKGPIHVSLTMPPPPPPKEKDGKKEDEKSGGLGSVFDMPYRLIYAVACQDSVLLYDTQQAGPIAIFRGLHYAGFTDIAW